MAKRPRIVLKLGGELLERPEVARELGSQGLAYVEQQYRWPTVVAKIDALLKTVTRAE